MNVKRKSVLTGLCLRSTRSGYGISGHAQIVENTPDVASELVDDGGNAAVALGLGQAGGETAQACGVLRPVSGTQGATVLVSAPIEEVVMGFNAPVVAVECE